MTPETVHCSFCARAEHEVAKIIAGPGIYICDECVQACVQILETAAGPTPRLPAWESLAPEEMLATLPRIAAVGAQLEGSLQAWVGELRRQGITWTRIGSALSMTRQSAWGRFSGED